MSAPEQRNPRGIKLPKTSEPATEARRLLEKLLQSGLIDPRTLKALPEKTRIELARLDQGKHLLDRLVEFELLTAYQADRVRSGNVQGLILGNYRVLDRLGVGNHGVVFRGEQRETGQKVAIKVLIPPRVRDSNSTLRFFAERKTVAQLCHPGIVRALDVGETVSDDPDETVLYYYVMELVPGLDLEQHVLKNGTMPQSLACEVAYQVADALTEAHKHNLVHRDVKPSNVVLTPAGRAMLLDFGLVRHLHSRQTQMGSLVGVLEWMAPEQATDAHAVDIRADLYSLGCTLFWCLTARSPYGVKGSARGSFQTPLPPLPPPSVRDVRNDLSPELDVVVARMMANLPDERYPDPQVVMAALAQFVSEKFALTLRAPRADALPPAPPAPPAPSSSARILIVGDDPVVCRTCREALEGSGISCHESSDGEHALKAVAVVMPDVVLLDVDLPGMAGLEVLKQLREGRQGADRKIIMFVASGSNVGPLLAAGADDYLVKPIDGVRLRSRVKTALDLSQTQDAFRPRPPPPLATQAEIQIEDPPSRNFGQSVINWLRGGTGKKSL